MKQFLFIIFLLFTWNISFAQNNKIDSLKQKFAITNHVGDKILLLCELSDYHNQTNPDSALIYAQQAIKLAEKIKVYEGEAYATLGSAFRVNGDFPKALEFLFKALQIFEKDKNGEQLGQCENQIAIVYSQLGHNPAAIFYQKRAIHTFESINDVNGASNSEVNLGRGYRRNNQLDSAAIYFQKAYSKLDIFRNKPRNAFLFMEMGTLQFQLGNRNEAFEFLRESIRINDLTNNHFYNSFAYNVLAVFFKELNQTDSCIFYAKKGFAEARQIANKFNILESSILLAQQYDSINIPEANFYLKIVNELNDELYGSKKVQELQKAISDEQQRQRKIEEDRVAYQNKIKQLGFLAGLTILILIAFFLYRNNIRKQKANALLKKQKEEIQNTLKQLKSTQSQLIQSEKMASLGELTAGIAHEIQNPLNFVNNFSEVNNELIDELNDELDKGDIEEAKAISKDIKENGQKINHHGKRADAIVKGMLQHSRTSNGVKEPTDINALADEYLRLSYHGLRAKDKSFNADFKTEFDETLPKINVIPQDIGRVLLNLINNAFYVVDKKSKEGAEDFKPEVIVSTKMMDKSIDIRVKDNGSGIPEEVKNKIFQPFFTTKPTGSGTGLGLSLSFDIVKAHGGEIKLESTEGQGTKFIIQLPT